MAYYRARAAEYDADLRGLGRYRSLGGDVAGSRADRDTGQELRRVVLELESMKPYGNVLELACGTGWWTQLLAPDADSVTAVDAAAEMLELARQRVTHPNIRYLVSNIFELKPDQRYDLVFFGFWLSHVPHDRFTAFWEIVRKAVSSDGHVFFVDELEHEASIEQWVSRDEVVRTVQGREFRAVKVFHRPEQLQATLETMGWQAEVQAAGREFYWGRCRPEAHG